MKQQKLQFMHKIIYRQKPARLAKQIKFVNQVHEHETRAQRKMNVFIPSVKSYGKRTFVYNASVAWNSLPATVQRTNDLNSFKTKLWNLLFYSAEESENDIYE
jgi:hypothetical protein